MNVLRSLVLLPALVTIGGAPPLPAGWLDPQAVYRLRVALATIHRDHASVEVVDRPDAANPFFTLVVPLPHAKGET